MTKEEILKRVKKFQGANREFSQELPPIIEGLVDLIDEAGPEVVNNLTSNSPTKALSANMGKELKLMVDGKVSKPETAGTAGQILQLDENGDPEWVEAAAVGATYDSAVSDTSTNAIQNKTIKKYVDDNFAQKDGYYASLTAGAAENLVGRGSVPAEFAFRTSGGDQDLGTGSALITKILGRTEAWNQLVQNGNFVDGTGWNTSNATLVGIASNKYTFIATAQYGCMRQSGAPLQLLQGHIYYFGSMVETTAPTSIYSQIRLSDESDNAISLFPNSSRREGVFTASATKTAYMRTIDVRASGWDNVLVSSCILIDLTLEGLGLTTADQFRALHPLGYYSPNAGVLKNNAATGLETTGFNQWDEEWEVGGYIIGTGAPYGYTDRIRSKNAIPVFPSTQYYFSNSNPHAIFFYDAGGNYISDSGSIDTNAFTTPANCAFIKFCLFSTYGTTYNHDICINISWSGYRNGEYEPYEKHTLNLGLNNLACHDEDNNAVVVNGLDGVGSSQDELVVENGWGTKIIKRRGRRAYQAGDESDATLMTDGTNTDYPLATPKVLTLDNPIPAGYYVNDFGTEARLPQDTADDPQAPFCAEIQYAMNATDTIRRLPSQYISDESMTNILTALKTAGIIADFTLTYDSEHQYFTCSVTAPTTEGE